MTADRLTMRLDPETREWLDGQAKLHDRSAAYVAKKAIRELKGADGSESSGDPSSHYAGR